MDSVFILFMEFKIITEEVCSFYNTIFCFDVYSWPHQ